MKKKSRNITDWLSRRNIHWYQFWHPQSGFIGGLIAFAVLIIIYITFKLF